VTLRAEDPRLAEAKSKCIREVAAALGLDVTQNGKKAYHPGGRGPGGRSPSITFGVKNMTEVWHCFRDGSGGDVIELVKHFKDYDFKMAVDWLAGPLPEPIKVRTYGALEEAPPEPTFAERTAACAAFYNALPKLDHFGSMWLLTERGISADTVAKFGIRYVDDDHTDEAMGQALRATDCKVVSALGLGKLSSKTDKMYGRFRGYWLVIPYFGIDSGGPTKIGHLQFRRVHRSGKKAEGYEKWRHTSGTVPWPWNIDAVSTLAEGDKLWFVEGALDGMRLEQEDVAAIGVPGVHWLTDVKTQRLVEILPDGVDGVEAFDWDDAGREAGPKLVDKMQEAGLRMSKVVWPDTWEGDWCEAFMSPDEPKPEVVDCPPKLRVISGPEPGDDMSVSLGDVFLGSTQRHMATDQQTKPWRSGIKSIDARFAPERGDTVVIAGRPAAGKTHTMMSLAYASAAAGYSKPGIVSIEMSRRQLGKRTMCATLGLTNTDNIGSSQAMMDKVALAAAEMPDVRVWFSGRSLDDVVDALTSLARRGCDVVMVDYLQYIKSTESNRYESLDLVSKTLKSTFKRLNILGIVGAQLKRGSTGVDRRPTIDDIKGCGSIEEDADHILLLDVPDPNNPSLKRLNLAKNKNGEPAEFALITPYPFGWMVGE